MSALESGWIHGPERAARLSAADKARTRLALSNNKDHVRGALAGCQALVLCLEEMAAAVVSRRVVTKPQPRGHRAGTGKPLRKEPGDGEYEVAPREGPGMEVVGKNPKDSGGNSMWR